MCYVLDTNIISDLVRTPQGRVAQRIRTVGEREVYTSIIVAAELRYGSTRKGSARLTAQVEAVLGAIDILPFEALAEAVYGSLPLPARANPGIPTWHVQSGGHRHRRGRRHRDVAH